MKALINPSPPNRGGNGTVKIASDNYALECNEKTWIANNRKAFDWYYGTYPEILESGITLPVSMDALRTFYLDDMNERNLTPQDAWFNCYTALWSYLLGRLTNQITVRGRNWWQLTKANLPGAVDKTFSDISKNISNPFGIPLWIYLGIAVLFLVKK